MGVYVKFPDGSMHWDESKADPSDSGGSVIDARSGQAIPGANRQSGPTGPGGNGPQGSQANPNGSYHAGPPASGGPFGSGGFTAGQSGVAPTGNPPGLFSVPGTPFADWLRQYTASQGGSIPGADPSTTADSLNPWLANERRMNLNNPGYYSQGNG